jgi:membrane-associated protease RseP (regulator of RpoE activity)
MTIYVLGAVGFVVVLLASVAVHEFGHLLTAKAFGMKATEFFVGFGTRLWSFRRGETEYGLKAIPAGGYVKIVGMTDLEEVAPEDEHRAFYRQPAHQRLIVLGAGAFTHFVLGFLLFLLVLAGLGTWGPSNVVGEVTECVPVTAGERCTGDDPPSPAKAAGLQPGDRIVSIGGTQVGSWEQQRDAIEAAGAGPAAIVVDRGGNRVTLTADLVEREQPVAGDPGRTERVAKLGFAPRFVLTRMNPIEGGAQSASYVWQTLELTGQVLVAIPSKIPDLLDATFGGAERDREGLIGIVGIARISGEQLSADAQPWSSRLGGFLFMMGSLNVFIGVFNLLPLLPLDGGHIAVLLFERARARVYRLLGRPDPGRVDLTKLLPIAYVFLVLIVGLTVLLVAADIINPLQI